MPLRAEGNSDLWLLSLDPRGPARQLLKSGAEDLNGEISPDDVVLNWAQELKH